MKTTIEMKISMKDLKSKTDTSEKKSMNSSINLKNLHRKQLREDGKLWLRKLQNGVIKVQHTINPGQKSR